MKRILVLLLIFSALATVSCSGGDSSVTLCDCEPDEYCVGDECYPTDESIAPAPDESKTNNQ